MFYKMERHSMMYYAIKKISLERCMSQLIYHLGTDFKRINEPESMLIWGAQTYIKRMIASYKNIFDEPVHIPLEPSEYPA